MYARTVEGKVLTLGVSGKLVRNSLIMYDRETHSLWSHLTGGAIQGPLKGSQLEVVPATQTSWKEWRRAYPQSRVLPHDYPGQTDSYRSYFGDGSAGILGRKREDARLPTKARVIGVRIENHPKAYAVDALRKARVVNDTFADTPLVLFSDGADSATVYRRDLNGRTLTFVSVGGAVTDQETGSHWDPVAGRAISGPLEGAALTPLPATNSFWFGWFDFFPGTALFG